MARFYCNHCGNTVERDSLKAWIRSFCTLIGRTVHLMRVRKAKRGG